MNPDPWCREIKYKTDEQMTYCMQMSLDFTSNVPWILFEHWTARTPATYFGSLVFVFVLAWIIETIPFIRWYDKNRKE